VAEVAAIPRPLPTYNGKEPHRGFNSAVRVSLSTGAIAADPTDNNPKKEDNFYSDRH
jgi:hypothetical protein